MQNSINLTTVLQSKLTPKEWPFLEHIAKQLSEYLVKSTRNRQYLEAQKAKDKIAEVAVEVRRRNYAQVEDRLAEALEEMRRKHQQEDEKMEREWQGRFQKVHNEYEEIISKKREKHEEQNQRHYQQLEMALPHTHSPDNELHKLRWEEEQYAREGKFLQAQRVKDKIEQRENDLNERHQKLRENNIATMMHELEAKQHNERRLLENRRAEKLEELQRESKKKLKELRDKQHREGKELRWIYNEQLNKYA